jgi:hypothetical protein
MGNGKPYFTLKLDLHNNKIVTLHMKITFKGLTLKEIPKYLTAVDMLATAWFTFSHLNRIS